eukprot:TRINITY_DN9147_c0_g1_i1.p1 TRINITY_DN9147_c0_g1~~TRINITY_DN9147_c0_g1_i1.p1  ORF type:complete len:185 (-),score=27.72 TRINITY_DN9147_c0_g1_i1:14-523(-)
MNTSLTSIFHNQLINSLADALHNAPFRSKSTIALRSFSNRKTKAWYLHEQAINKCQKERLQFETLCGGSKFIKTSEQKEQYAALVKAEEEAIARSKVVGSFPPGFEHLVKKEKTIVHKPKPKPIAKKAPLMQAQLPRTTNIKDILPPFPKYLKEKQEREAAQKSTQTQQ